MWVLRMCVRIFVCNSRELTEACGGRRQAEGRKGRGQAHQREKGPQRRRTQHDCVIAGWVRLHWVASDMTRTSEPVVRYTHSPPHSLHERHHHNKMA